MDISRFLTKETILIVILCFWMIIQSNYFATKLDIANLRLELQQYSDNGDKEILKELDMKYEKIILKLDRIK